MQIKDCATRLIASGRVVNKKPVPGVSRQEEGTHRERPVAYSPSFRSTKSTSEPTVAKVAPSISSSPTEKPKRSSSVVRIATTAMESSSGIAPRSGVLAVKPVERPLRLRTSSSMDRTSCWVAKLILPSRHLRSQHYSWSSLVRL